MNLDDVRVLTVAQPWAGAIACEAPDLAKDVENRTWSADWRGPLLVNAGKRWSRRGFDDGRVRRLLDAGLLLPTRAGIVAVAGLVDVHPDRGCCRPWGESLTCDRCSRPRRLPEALADPADGLNPLDACRCIDLPPAPGQPRRRPARGMYHWRLPGRVVLAEPVPCVGTLGLRPPPPGVADAVRAALLAAVPA